MDADQQGKIPGLGREGVMVRDGEMGRREFLGLAGAAPLIGAAAAQSGSVKLKAGASKIDITPGRPRLCASGDKPDPPVAYARLHSRCLTIADGARRLVIVNYDL